MMAYTQPVVLEPFVVLVQLCHSAQNAIDWNQESFFFDKIPKKLSLLQRDDSIVGERPREVENAEKYS